jgi:hypothetical protein
MRKKLAILLISIHLVGNTEAGQAFKIPKLLDHFSRHQQQNPSLSFIQFFLMHYGGDDGTDADNDQDQQLPFHNLHHTTTAVVYSPMLKVIPDTDLFLWETRNFISHLSGPIPHILLPIDIQPPRL